MKPISISFQSDSSTPSTLNLMDGEEIITPTHAGRGLSILSTTHQDIMESIMMQMIASILGAQTSQRVSQSVKPRERRF